MVSLIVNSGEGSDGGECELMVQCVSKDRGDEGGRRLLKADTVVD